jgi:hypothetical protein
MVNIYIKRAISLFICIACLVIVILLNFLRHSIEGGKKIIKDAFHRNLVDNYIPKTGDILLMHYLGHGLIGIPVAEHWPTHAALVWVKNDGSIFIVECTKFTAPSLPNVLKSTLKKKRGVRVVPWKDYVNAIDDVLYIRRLVKGSIKSEDVKSAVDEYGKTMDFETRIADSMTLDVTVAIGFAPVWPKFCLCCAQAAKLHEIERRKNQSFCSEFIAILVHKLGGIDPSFRDFYKVSPASFLKSAGLFDQLTLKSPKNLQWGEDEMLIRRF